MKRSISTHSAGHTRRGGLFQKRETLWVGGMRQRLEERVYTRQFLVRHNFVGIRRHLACGVSDVGGERLERNRVRAKPWSAYRGALSLATVALVAAIFRVKLLSF